MESCLGSISVLFQATIRLTVSFLITNSATGNQSNVKYCKQTNFVTFAGQDNHKIFIDAKVFPRYPKIYTKKGFCENTSAASRMVKINRRKNKLVYSTLMVLCEGKDVS